MSEILQQQPTDADRLLALQDEMRQQETLSDLAFFMANRTRAVCVYEKAVVWRRVSKNTIRILSISGSVQIDAYTQIHQFFSDLILKGISIRPGEATVANLPKSFQEIWPDGFPKHIFSSLMLAKNGDVTGGILFFNEKLFTEADIWRIRWIEKAYNHTWNGLWKAKPISLISVQKNRIIAITMGMIVTLCLIRIPQSVLAPASVRARDPFIVTSPMTATIEKIHFDTNKKVSKGDLLISLDARVLQHNYNVSIKELAVEREKLKKALKTGYDDVRNLSEIGILREKIQEKEVTTQYNQRLLDESKIRAPHDGVFVVDDPQNWTGKPINAGEKIGEVIDEKILELEIWLPVTEALGFKPGDEGKLFLNSAPLHAKAFSVRSVQFYAQVNPSGILAHKVIGDFKEAHESNILGHQGTARILGENVSIMFFILRKPLSHIRQFLGI